MRCDVCNTIVTKGDGEKVTPDFFIYLLDNGFGLDETNIQMLVDVGMSRADAEKALKSNYRQSSSDWLLCRQCAENAKHAEHVQKETLVSPDYLAVTQMAEGVGMGFDTLGAPVALSRAVWHECVEWTDVDTERQTYQEQDARLWDVLFTGGGTLQLMINQFLKDGVHLYSVLCVPRDGTSTEASQVNMQISQKTIRGKQWLVIEKAETMFEED